MQEFIDEHAESSSEEEPVKDFDVEESSKYFKMCEPTEEIHVGERAYVLHLNFQNKKNILASATAAGKVKLHQLTERTFTPLAGPKDFDNNYNVCQLKFDPNHENVLFCTRSNGLCQCYDLRTNAIVYELKDESSGKIKPFTCMDINQNSRVICCGTEKIQADSFLLFFDTRQRSLLGGYWESHDDDITDVKFHPHNPDQLASCSTDGLLNCYNLKEQKEDDALIGSFNTESSVSLINWSQKDGADHVSCITHTNDLQMYNVESQDKIFEFKRNEVTSTMKRASHIDCHLIGCHTEANETEVFLLATSNFNRGECLRSLQITADNKLQPAVDFQSNNQIVRTSNYDAEHKYLFTGGELGFIHFWRPTDSDLPNAVFKKKHRSHKHHIKPY